MDPRSLPYLYMGIPTLVCESTSEDTSRSALVYPTPPTLDLAVSIASLFSVIEPSSELQINVLTLDSMYDDAVELVLDAKSALAQRFP